MRKGILSLLVTSLITSAVIMSGCGVTGIPEVNTQNQETSESAKQDASAENKETHEVEKTADPTMEDLAEANRRDNILKKHRNWYSEVKISDENSKMAVQAYGVYGFSCYNEDGVSYFESDFLAEDGVSHDKQTSFFNGETEYYKASGDRLLNVSWFTISDDEKKEYLTAKSAHPECFSPFSCAEDSDEAIDTVTDDNDGKLTVITYTSAELCPEIINLPDEWKGGKVRYTYTFDKETLEISGLVCDVLVDGVSYDFLTQKNLYDIDTPEGFDKMCELVYNYKNENPKNPKTITVIYDPDTDEEESFRITVDCVYGIYPVIREGYSCYKDPKGKVPFIPAEGNNDVTIFAIKD